MSPREKIVVRGIVTLVLLVGGGWCLVCDYLMHKYEESQIGTTSTWVGSTGTVNSLDLPELDNFQAQEDLEMFIQRHELADILHRRECYRVAFPHGERPDSTVEWRGHRSDRGLFLLGPPTGRTELYEEGGECYYIFTVTSFASQRYFLPGITIFNGSLWPGDYLFVF